PRPALPPPGPPPPPRRPRGRLVPHQPDEAPAARPPHPPPPHPPPQPPETPRRPQPPQRNRGRVAPRPRFGLRLPLERRGRENRTVDLPLHLAGRRKDHRPAARLLPRRHPALVECRPPRGPAALGKGDGPPARRSAHRRGLPPP